MEGVAFTCSATKHYGGDVFNNITSFVRFAHAGHAPHRLDAEAWITHTTVPLERGLGCNKTQHQQPGVQGVNSFNVFYPKPSTSVVKLREFDNTPLYLSWLSTDFPIVLTR
jgi:hypothetical protein